MNQRLYLFLSLKYTDINACSRARCQDERWPDEDQRFPVDDEFYQMSGTI